ncbi:MAG: hypothetical protein AAF512_09705, partial [Pseudomonadota bacterium]
FDKFEKYNPWGSADDIADFLIPYAEAGCRLFNVQIASGDEAAGIEVLGEVKQKIVDAIG